MADAKLSALATESAPAFADYTYVIDATPTSQKVSWDRVLGLLTLPVQGRLTTESGVPVSSSDRTAQGTLYYTPYLGKIVTLYDGTRWRAYSTAEVSLALTATSGKNYDVFLYDNAGTLTLELSAAWTNDTTRADALTTQDGVQVKSGAATRRWLGTIRASGANVTEDSAQNRLVWNAYNQVQRPCFFSEGTGHTYNSATTRSWNNSAANQIAMVVGVALSVSVSLGTDLAPGLSGFAITRAILDWTSGTGTYPGGEAITAARDNVATAIDRIISDPSVVLSIPLGYHYVRVTEEDASNVVSNFTTMTIAAGLLA